MWAEKLTSIKKKTPMDHQSELHEHLYVHTFNNRHTYIQNVEQGGGGGRGGGGCNPSPGFLRCYNISQIFLHLIDSLSCDLQDEVNIMGYSTARVRDVIQNGRHDDRYLGFY